MMLLAAMRLVAIGTKRTCGNDRLFVRFWGEADVYGPLALRASVAHDPSRHLTINFAVMHNGILTLEVLRCPALKFKGSRNCDRVGSFRSDAKISDCRFDLRVPQ